METLPPEVLERIVRQLTPQDLGRCSAVCLKWHEVFNQDWMWEPHCEPELVESLHTVPCVAKPGFEAPEGPLPVSDWKLSFMRETCYWKNWRRVGDEISLLHCYNTHCEEQISEEVGNENILELKRENLLRVDFFTDNEVVLWCTDCIKILDVGVKPAADIATTVTSIEISNQNRCMVIESHMLAVEKYLPSSSLGCSFILVEVFTVDRVEKSIKLKHTITLNEHFSISEYYNLVLLKGHLYFRIAGEKNFLYDLKTGNLLMEQSFPMSQNPSFDRNYFRDMNPCVEIVASQSSDYVAFGFLIDDDTVKYCIYNLKDHFTNLVAEITGKLYCVTLNRSWLALRRGPTLSVINLLSNEESTLSLKCFPGIYECDDNFIFSCEESKKRMLKMYNPSLKSLTNICELRGKPFTIVYKSFIAIFEDYLTTDSGFEVWKLSGQRIKKWNIFPLSDGEINKTKTKMLMEKKHLARECRNLKNKEFCILYLW